MSGKRRNLAFRCSQIMTVKTEDMEVDSDEDYDDFWKDQKVILGGRLAVPTPEQMKHSPALPSGKALLSLRII